MPRARRGPRAIAAPRSVPPTPANGSRTSSPDFVKNSISLAMSRGGLFAPCALRSVCPSSDGYAVVHTDFVKYSHCSPVSSFSVFLGWRAIVLLRERRFLAGQDGAFRDRGLAHVPDWREPDD